MRVEELTLISIGEHMHSTISKDVVTAVGYAARIGWGDTTCRAFVTALVMTDTLEHPAMWPSVLNKIKNLKIESDLAALEDGRVITREVE